MKKMTLDVEALRVESFDTVDARGGRGTVGAHDGGCTVSPYPSCVITCGIQPACTEDICRMSGTCPMQCCL